MLAKILPVMAVAALLSACSSDSGTTADTAGQGSASSLGMSGMVPGSGPGTGNGGVECPPRQPGGSGRQYRRPGLLRGPDSSSVGADQRPVLERQAAWDPQEYRQVTVAVEGHADERGTRKYNLALGQRRANAARDSWFSRGSGQPDHHDQLRQGPAGRARFGPAGLGTEPPGRHHRSVRTGIAHPSAGRPIVHGMATRRQNETPAPTDLFGEPAPPSRPEAAPRRPAPARRPAAAAGAGGGGRPGPPAAARPARCRGMLARGSARLADPVGAAGRGQDHARPAAGRARPGWSSSRSPRCSPAWPT